MSKVRFGIVGIGAVGGSHVRNMLASKSRSFCLAAVCDIVPELAERAAAQADVPHFVDYKRMIDSGLIDAVIIATPHYWHAPICIYAARKKIHVLSEKPLSSTVGHARAMIAECRKNKVVLCAMLQHRTRPVMIQMNQMVERGQLGEVFRVHMVCSNWFRTQAYYDSGAWRGTWDGEGGGVLINQGLHHLDLFQWTGLGLPKRVMGMLDTRQHRIEVEDTANFLCDYGKGRIGYLYASTAEQPGMEQFIISGDKGTLKWSDGKLMFGKMRVPISRYVYACKTTWADAKLQGCDWQEVKPPARKSGHIEIIRNMAGHLLRGEPLYAEGKSAVHGLELSNAMYLAGFKNKIVDVPVRAEEMERLFSKLERERSTGKGGDLRRAARGEVKKLLG